MNKVFVTGLGVGKDMGVCESCGFDYSWIYHNPSTLIWSDKVILTESAWKERLQNNDKYDKAVNLILDIAYDEKIIELIKPKELFDDSVSEECINEAEYDTRIMKEKFPKNIIEGDKGVPGEVLINGNGYCIPYIASIYSSLKIAESLNANCLFNREDYDYLYYKYGITANLITNNDTIKCLDEIFNIMIPNQLILHNYAYTSDEECNDCQRINYCNSTYLKDIEKNLLEMLKWRQYDEILRAKEEVQKIIDMKSMIGKEINPMDIKREFNEKQKKINLLIKKVFPKIKRWTNLTTVIATPISIYYAATLNKPITIASTSALGFSKMLDEYMKYYENKHNWVGFINKINNI